MINFYRRGDENAAGRDGVFTLVARDGTYSKSLAPGVYTIIWGTPTGMGPGTPVQETTEPTTVRVIAGRRRTVDFAIDTRILR